MTRACHLQNKHIEGAPESTGSPIPRSTATEPTTTATEAQNTFSSGVPTPTTTASQRSSGVNAGAIAGGVVGGVAFLAIVAVIGFWYSLRRKQRNEETEVNVFESHLPTSSTTPYNPAVASGPVMRETPGHRSQQGSIVSLNTYSPPITVSHSRTSNRSDYYLKSHTGTHEFEQLFHVSDVACNIGCLYDLRPVRI